VDHATQLAEDLGDAGASVTGGGIGEQLVGDVVVLATPYDAALEIARSRGDDLGDKVVVDITNPVDWATFDRLVTPPESSAAEEIAKLLPPAARVVKAFNTTFAGTLIAAGVAGQDLDVLIAGDDADAKNQVSDLARSGGMRPVDVGSLRRAQQLEHLGFLHMALQENLGSGYGSAVKFIKP
jgi:8-hydroxy-5-deazaflavin:NADPH oxidoreductase